MTRCSKCNKLIWFWNKFNREYGFGMVLDKQNCPKEIVRFCSYKCCFAYKNDLLIDFNKSKEVLEE